MELLQSKEVVKNEMIVFHILDCSIQLFSTETSHGWQTCAEIEGAYHYLGDQLINIETAVDYYQYLNHRVLSQEEIKIIMDENIFNVKRIDP